MVIMYIISISNCAKFKQVYADINIFSFFNGVPVQHCISLYQFSPYKISSQIVGEREMKIKF